jgi:asparagine synthase (glutamine-hydrolysing)
MFAIPREQSVRPGHRRSLMRRALAGIVPHELLNRKRKAFVSRAPMVMISAQWASLIEMSQGMDDCLSGIVSTARFCETIQKTRQRQDVPIVLLMRTLNFELWLRGVRDSGILKLCAPIITTNHNAWAQQNVFTDHS